MDTTKWSFNDTKAWNKVDKWNCGGAQQSPINVITDSVIQCKSLCDVEIIYKPSKCRVNFKNGLIRFKIDKGSYIVFKGVTYMLTEITVHTPSMHQIDGESYDAEIQLIHTIGGDDTSNDDNIDHDSSNSERGVIISCLFRKGHHHGDPERFITEVINSLPSESINYYKDIPTSNDWGGSLLLPKKKSFFMYNGSLPFPPCTEGYQVIVMEEIMNLGETTIDILSKHLGKNIRRVQPIYDREIFYNIGEKTKLVVDINTASSDKYLKCIKKKREPRKVEPVQEVKPGFDIGFSDKLKKTLKNIFFPLTTLVLLIVAVFFVKFLYSEIKDETTNPPIIKGAYLKKMFKLIAGRKVATKEWENWNSSICKNKN